MYQWGSNRNSWAGCQMGLSKTTPLILPKYGVVEKHPFQISASKLEIDENVYKAHLRTNWLAVK